MSALTPQQQQQFEQRMNALIDKMEARLDRLEKLTAESPADRAARLGAESATGSEQELELANRRHRRELQDPAFAKNYFACQRLTRTKVLRQFSMVPARRLA